jgi:5-methyltetrahydropteroyltriglutamate--homocysteine methyltransferase
MEETVQATQDWERGRIGAHLLREMFDRDVGQLVKLQKELSFDFLSDGQLTMAWQDIFTPFTSFFKGVKKGPLIRWFNTNTFFYAPVVQSEIVAPGDAVWRSIETSLISDSNPLKVVIPDPLTFAELSEDEYYGSKERLMFAYAGAIREELNHLGKHGVSYVQYSAPSLVARFREGRLSREDFAQVSLAVRESLKKTGLESGYLPFFGDAAPYFPELFEIPVDDVGVDLTETDARKLPKSKKGLIAGVANGRSGYVEPVDVLSRRLREIPSLEKYHRVLITPSCDLRYVPRTVADEKMRRLAETRSVLEEEDGSK